MKEKTKKALSYIACALGGLALGIGLLGGLSMCATRQTETESVNTILTAEPRRATDLGDYRIQLIEGYETNLYFSEAVTYTRNQADDLILFGGTTADSIKPTLILPVEVKINYAPTFLNSTIEEVTFAIYKSDSGFPSSWGNYIAFSPLGAIAFMRPVSQVTYWYSYGYQWDTSTQIYAETTGLSVTPSNNWTPSIIGYRFMSQTLSYTNHDMQAYARYGLKAGLDLTEAYIQSANIYRSMLTTGNDTYEDGYERGYDLGKEAGINVGMQLGSEGGNMTNVFALFTSAFDAVGGFFNLKVFGFLPLYWFFLAPLFVALVALILRMVKH